MESVVTLPVRYVRRSRRLMLAASSFSSMRRSEGLATFSSRGGELLSSPNHSGCGCAMISRAHVAMSIGHRLQRAVAPSEFLGTRLCRSLSSASLFNDGIQQQEGLAWAWMCHKRSAGAPASGNQTRKMSGGNVFFSLFYAVAGMPMFLMLMSSRA